MLSGDYVEAGDTGRHRVVAGDVITHGSFESHLNRFGDQGAEVLVIPLPPGWSGSIVSCVNDPDRLIRLAARAPIDAAEALRAQMTPRTLSHADWPDMLADALLIDPNLQIATWARAVGLHPGSVSRGFSQQFGVTPASFRLSIRACRAARAILCTSTPLAQIALDCSFVDQSHMCNAVRDLTGVSPTGLRRNLPT